MLYVHIRKAYDVRMYLSYPGTFIVHPVMRQNFVSTVGLKCKLDLALCHIAWDCPTKLDTWPLLILRYCVVLPCYCNVQLYWRLSYCA